MRIPTRQRLSYKQARNTLCIAFLLGAVFSLFLIYANYFRVLNEIDQQVQSLANISHDPASRIAYNIDTELAKELVKGLAQVPLLEEASIVEPSGNILAHSRNPSTNQQYQSLVESIFGNNKTYRYELSVEHDPEEELGELILVSDLQPSGIKFITDSITLLSTVLIQSCALAAAMLVMFYFMLTKPLSYITSQLTSFHASTSMKHRLKSLPQHDNDEIGLIISATNQQLNEIEDSFAELKLAEQERELYTLRLEQAVEDRTKELTKTNSDLTVANELLETTKEKAVKSSEARAAFLANMSHEIRTPLSGVLGMISLALEADIDENTREQLQLASSSGLTLQQILNDILDISKVESGKLSLEEITFNLREALEEIATLFSQAPQAKDLEIVLIIDPDFPEQLTGDPTRIRQILSNIINNALKFTQQGSVTITAEFINSGSTEHNIAIHVQDTGIGMTQEEISRIFTPFSQANTKTTRQFGGTGLGLTLVKQLTERMNGKVEVESTKGLGSTFSIYLQLPHKSQHRAPVFLHNTRIAIIESPSHIAPEAKSIARQVKQWGGDIAFIDSEQISTKRNIDLFIDFNEHIQYPDDIQSKRLTISGQAASNNHALHIQRPIRLKALRNAIKKALGNNDSTNEADKNKQHQNDEIIDAKQESVLIVEDNPVNQKVARGILKKLGFENVYLAENGQEAVEQVTSRRFDIILMDCHMPIMDGYEATTNIRTLDNGKDVPIIAVTANIVSEDRERCFESGMNDFLTKPYRKTDLQEKLEYWLRFSEA